MMSRSDAPSTSSRADTDTHTPSVPRPRVPHRTRGRWRRTNGIANAPFWYHILVQYYNLIYISVVQVLAVRLAQRLQLLGVQVVGLGGGGARP